MTLPNERYNSLKNTKKFLEDLCDPGKTPRVPSFVRERASSALKHYPTDWDIEQIAEACPDIVDKVMFSDRIAKRNILK